MNITSGIYNGRKVLAPSETTTRPTLSKVRMSIFNTLYSLMDFEGKSFLDMYAGSGIMGLEALSRGFQRVVEIEKDSKALGVVKTNYKTLAIAGEIYHGDAIRVLKKLDEEFDVAYIDPPYFSGIYEKSLQTVRAKIVVLEHVCAVDFGTREIVKQKTYGKKTITFLK